MAEADPAFAARVAERLLTTPSARRERLVRSVERSPLRLAYGLAVRAHVLRAPKTPAARDVEGSLRRALAHALRPSELRVREVTLDAPRAVLATIRQSDAVHPVKNDAELERRFAADRAVLALVHAQRPDAVIAFVLVAFTHGRPARIESILDPDSPIEANPDHAIFYGISNSDPGTVGLALGTTLLERALERTKRPGIRRWVTMSPIPGLRRWLTAEPPPGLASLASEERLPTTEERPLLVTAAERFIREAKLPDGRVLDPVARFHLGNGARLDAALPDAHHSSRALRESAGVMASYIYREELP